MSDELIDHGAAALLAGVRRDDYDSPDEYARVGVEGMGGMVKIPVEHVNAIENATIEQMAAGERFVCSACRRVGKVTRPMNTDALSDIIIECECGHRVTTADEAPTPETDPETCPACDSTATVGFSTGDRVCRSCNHNYDPEALDGR